MQYNIYRFKVHGLPFSVRMEAKVSIKVDYIPLVNIRKILAFRTIHWFGEVWQSGTPPKKKFFGREAPEKQRVQSFDQRFRDQRFIDQR